MNRFQVPSRADADSFAAIQLARIYRARHLVVTGAVVVSAGLLALPARAAEVNARGNAVESSPHEVITDGAAALATPVAPAQSGFAYGARLGLSRPFGQAAGGTERPEVAMSELVALRLPLWLDLGYQLEPHWWIGLQAQLAAGLVGDTCPTDADCSFTELRLGAEALYTVVPHGRISPWLGLSLGWESLWLKTRAAIAVPGDSGDTLIAATSKELFGGPQLTLQGGIQFKENEGIAWGPFLSSALGVYVRDGFQCDAALACPTDHDVKDHRAHLWLTLGVRGTHGP